MINVIVAFSRPQFKHNIIDNFKRQNFSDKRLIIVENGEGVGTFKDSTLPYAVLESGQHHALAKNEAIEWIRKHGGGWWACMDDDDYYGPNYLTEIESHTDKTDVIGKQDIFVKQNDDFYLLSKNVENTYTDNAVLGATLAARAENSPELQTVVNDDLLFCQDVIKNGGKIFTTSKFNFIYNRMSGKQAWSVNAEQLAQMTLFVGGTVYKWSMVNREIANGTEPISGYEVMEKEEFSRKHCPIWTANHDKYPSFSELVRSYGIEPDPSLIKDNA